MKIIDYVKNDISAMVIDEIEMHFEEDFGFYATINRYINPGFDHGRVVVRFFNDAIGKELSFLVLFYWEERRLVIDNGLDKVVYFGYTLFINKLDEKKIFRVIDKVNTDFSKMVTVELAKFKDSFGYYAEIIEGDAKFKHENVEVIFRNDSIGHDFYINIWKVAENLWTNLGEEEIYFNWDYFVYEVAKIMSMRIEYLNEVIDEIREENYGYLR